MGGSSARPRPTAPPLHQLRRSMPRLASAASRSGIVAALALVLLVTGCGGTERRHGRRAARPPSTPDRLERRRGAPRPAADPGFRRPRKVGNCTRMTARPVPGIGRRAAARSRCRRPHTRSSPTSVPARGRQRRHPGRPSATRSASATAPRPTAQLAGGTLADRATSLLTWTLFTPERAPARARRPLAALRRAGAQRQPAVPLPPGPPAAGARGCPSSCASARPRTEPTSPAPSRTPSASRPSSVRRRRGLPGRQHLHRRPPGTAASS